MIWLPRVIPAALLKIHVRAQIIRHRVKSHYDQPIKNSHLYLADVRLLILLE
jgi:hypothetical protein